MLWFVFQATTAQRTRLASLGVVAVLLSVGSAAISQTVLDGTKVTQYSPTSMPNHRAHMHG